MTTGIALAALLGGFSSIIMMIVWGGFMTAVALSTLWGWFIVPVFGLPAISLIQAYGIALTAGCLKSVNWKKDPNPDTFGKAIAKGFFVSLLKCLLLLACGWVAKSFM